MYRAAGVKLTRSSSNSMARELPMHLPQLHLPQLQLQLVIVQLGQQQHSLSVGLNGCSA